ncbi:MAG: pyridoxal phosphate-dependent aminotransferase, partial [Armatimonadota bacterium]
MPALSDRTADLTSFKVMDVLEAAAQLERAGCHVVHLEVGQPDFPTPPVILEAGIRALRDGATGYTHSLGHPELREAVCRHYGGRYGVEVSPDQVIVTSGTSPAMLLVFSALCNPGDEIVLSDPHYACYPNFVRYVGARPVTFDLLESDGYRPRVERIRAVLGPRTKGIVVNSPANPTGVVVAADDLRAIAELGPFVISDEIYHALNYGSERERSILEFTDRAFVLNGFSKRYAMPGWRLGYVIAPEDFVPAMQVMQQNFFICAADFVQHAGIAALRYAWPDVERMAAAYDQRRRAILSRPRQLGFRIGYEPTGAF